MKFTLYRYNPGDKKLERYRDFGLSWIAKLLVSTPCSLSEQSVLDLLSSRLVNEPAGETTRHGWILFRAFFLQAGLDSGKLVAVEPDGGGFGAGAGAGEQQVEQQVQQPAPRWDCTS